MNTIVKTKLHNKTLGVRQKMVTVLLTVLTVALSISGWFTYQQQEDDTLRETTQRTQDIARIVSQSLADNVIGYDYHGIQIEIDELVKSQDVTYAKVVNARGTTMAEASSSASHDNQVTTIERDIVFDTNIVGKLVIAVDNKRIVTHMEAQKRSIIFREGLIILSIAIGEFVALSYIIVRPVSKITKAMENGIDENGLISQDIAIDTHDEFGLLANQFNDMRSHINDMNRRLQSKIESTDQKLKTNYEQLQQQSVELQNMNRELQRLAITDSLTGLYNRRQFDSLIETDLALSQRHGDISSVVLVDIDHFKQINDTYGHKTGDKVLTHIAKILQKNIRRTDTICRIGGEEFALICRRADAKDVVIVAEKLRQSIASQAYRHGSKMLNITVSLGVASLPTNGDAIDPDEIFRQADIALYFSKEHGRNQTHHFNDIKDVIEPPKET